MANEYLQRTPTSAGNQRIWTWSGWVKRNSLSDAQHNLWRVESGASGDSGFRFDLNTPSDSLRFYLNGATGGDIQESAKRRDLGSWMHIMAVYDSTASTASSRVQLYVNGARVRSLSTESYPTLNYLSSWNGLVAHKIGASTGEFSKQQLTDIFFIDGQALTPDVFGFNKPGKGYISSGSSVAADFRGGQWVPKTPRIIRAEINRRGGFGVNGFYLPMNDSNNFGADFHCTPNSIIKLQENLPQPRCRIDGVGDYTGALRDDPFKQYLVLALPFVSGGLQNGFGDYSAAIRGSGTPKTITNSNTAISTFSSYYGSAGNFTSSSSSYITTPRDISDYNMESGDFTVEGWVYFKSINTGQYTRFFSIGNTSNEGIVWELNQSTSTLTFCTTIGADYNAVTTPFAIVANQWYHIAQVRKGTTYSAYINGVCIGIDTSTNGAVNFNSNTAVVIGAWEYPIGSYARFADAYMQDIRIYKGVAKYTGGFDVPRPYTPVGIATWRAVPDTTANNFATLNPLVPSVFSSGDRSINNGNLTVTTISTGNGTNARSTIGMSSGKWYAETYVDGIYGFLAVKGIGREDNQLLGSGGDAIHYWAQNGNKYDYTNGSLTISSYGSTYTTGDIIGISINADNGEVIFYKNGVSQGVAKTFLTSQYPLFIQMEDGASTNTVTFHMNFGQNPTFSGNTTAGTFTDSNGKGLFKYQPPAGFLALCEDNLPKPTVEDPGKHFKAVLWTGNGSSRSISGVGFQPDLVWIKSRTNGAYFHNLVDSVRGPSRRLASNIPNAEDDASAGGATPILGSFDYDGFSLPNGNVNVNENNGSYIAWCWKAGNTTQTNTNGSITSTVSVNQTAGFSIVSFTMNSTPGTYTIGHGLNNVPKFIVTKQRNEAYGWWTQHASLGSTRYLALNETSAAATLTWGGDPTRSTFTINNSFAIAGTPVIAYCWAEIEGYSKFGSYVGNGSTDGPFVYCGFKPAWVMIKRTSSSQNWVIIDNCRGSTNPTGQSIFANTSDTEFTDLNLREMDFLSNGFKIRAGAGTERNDGTYIFAAFAESPFQTANAK